MHHQDGYKKLASEPTSCGESVRPKITNEVMWAGHKATVRKNAEYIYGKRRLREIDRRLRYLKKRIDSVTVIEPRPEKEAACSSAPPVEVEDEEGKHARYRIIGSG